ncbi:MAG: cytochrome c biogenesis heme-transporting ATPase CcmA [Gammaproteobacteria bacterium]|nr:cytochrome c biogenesis heme-transporting ATPase CcmA [Gammaproteobacteria bacterium]
MDTQTLVQVNNLAVYRGMHRLFAQLSFSASSGEIIHIRGLNGAGKTTLLRCLAGLTLPDDGEIAWFGEPASTRPSGDARAAMTLVGHKDGLKSGLTPLENLRHGDGLRADEPKLTCSEALARAGLAERLHVPVGQLSAGQRRRAALARLLSRQTLIWLLDEPFTSLDVDGIAEVTSWMRQHAEDGGLVLLTSHQPLAIGMPVRELWVGAQ